MHRFLPSGSTVKLESNSDRVADCENNSDKIHAVLTDTNWEQKLSEASYVIFDTETTGLQPFRGDRITSLAAVIVEKGVIQDRSFNVLVNPQRPISAASSRITGITDGMVSDKPTLHEVLPDFLDFIGNKTLVAHCAAFDLAFLNAELLPDCPARILNPVIDTYLVANIMLPEMKSCSENLVNRLGLQMKGRHTALGDSLMTAEIFLLFWKNYSQDKFILWTSRGFSLVKRTVVFPGCASNILVILIIIVTAQMNTLGIGAAGVRYAKSHST